MSYFHHRPHPPYVWVQILIHCLCDENFHSLPVNYFTHPLAAPLTQACPKIALTRNRIHVNSDVDYTYVDHLRNTVFLPSVILLFIFFLFFSWLVRVTSAPTERYLPTPR